MFIRLLDWNGEAIAKSELRHAEPLWGTGRIRRFIPRPDASGEINPLGDLGAEGIRLYVEWQWTDGGRSLRDVATHRQARHVKSKTYDLNQYGRDIYEGRSLVDPDPLFALPRIREDLDKIVRAVERIARTSESTEGRTSASGVQRWVDQMSGERDVASTEQGNETRD